MFFVKRKKPAVAVATMTRSTIPIVSVLSIVYLPFPCGSSAKGTHTPHYTGQMKYFALTAKMVEVMILSVQNEIPCGNLIHEHDRSLQGDHAERPSGMQNSLPGA